VVAAIILVTAVLPAEYDIDPLGTGAALGLVVLSDESAVAGTPSAVVHGVYTAQPNIYKVDSRDITLTPGEGVEIKYHMERGGVMVYSWKATGVVEFEFHGEPDEKPDPNYYESYELDDQVGRTESFGSFIAPSSGIHGWYWENVGEQDVTVHLTTAGFYDWAARFDSNGSEEVEVHDAD
jgi:hypothetical protein